MKLLTASEDRIKLIKMLETLLPSLQENALRDMLFLMLAVLHDCNALEFFAREQMQVANHLTAKMESMCSLLNREVERIESGTAITQ